MANSPFAPDDQDPNLDDQYYGHAAQLLPQPAAPSVQTAPPQAQAQQRPQILLPTPIDPPGMTPNYKIQQDQLTKDSAPVDRKANAPKWWERLGGMMVAGGVGFGSGAQAGINAGTKAMSGRYDAAVEDRQGKIEADKTALAATEQSHNMDVRQYELQHTNYSDRLAQAQAQQAQGNTDRTNDREVANDLYTHTRDTANDTRNQTNLDRTDAREKQDHTDVLTQQGVTNGFAQQHLNLDRTRESREAANGNKSGGGSKTTVTPAQFQTMLSTKDREYASAQKNKDAEMSVAFDPAEKASIEQKYAGIASDLQDRWNSRIATADPEGKYAPKPPGQPQAPAAAPQQAKPNAPKIGDVKKGYRFTGGDPAKSSNWKKQ